MSYTGTTYDGSDAGRDLGTKERGDSFDDKIENGEPASTKRTRSNFRLLENSPEDEEGRDRYLITYADLITLLLGLFIILYAMSKIDSEKYEKVIYAMSDIFGHNGRAVGKMTETTSIGDLVEPIVELKNKLNNVIVENNLASDISLIESERGITVRIQDKILFKSGDAALGERPRYILGKISKVLNKLDNDIRVEGHTDDRPISTAQFPSNWHLSIQRATNTAYYLMESEGIDPERVSVVGYSEYKPIVPNDSPEHRAQNRRVDIVILKK